MYVDLTQDDVNPMTDFLYVEGENVAQADVLKRISQDKRVEIENMSIARNIAKGLVSLQRVEGPSRLYFLRRELEGYKILGSSKPFDLSACLPNHTKLSLQLPLPLEYSSTKGRPPSTEYQTQPLLNEETHSSSQNMESKAEFDFENFRRALESIEESKEEGKSFDEPQSSTVNTQRSLP